QQARLGPERRRQVQDRHRPPRQAPLPRAHCHEHGPLRRHRLRHPLPSHHDLLLCLPRPVRLRRGHRRPDLPARRHRHDDRRRRLRRPLRHA
ncbi:hypothetical protein BN1723_018597, partial [Verticillium longisporum]